MKRDGWMGRLVAGAMIVVAGVALAAPNIGFYCNYNDDQNLDTGSPAAGTLTGTTTVAGGKLVIPPASIAGGVAYGQARSYLSTNGAGWGTNTIAAILKFDNVAGRKTLYASAGLQDNSWGIIFWGRSDLGTYPSLEIYTNGVRFPIELTSVTLATNVEYFLAASWNDAGSGSPMTISIFLRNRYTDEIYFSNKVNTVNTVVPPKSDNTNGDPMGSMYVGRRSVDGLTPCIGKIEAIWGIRQYTASAAEYNQLYSNLAVEAEAPAVHVALDGDGSAGTNWATAYTNLQTAIDDPNAPRGVWVKAGVYAITNPLVMASNARLYGGFGGTETLLLGRNPTQNVTVVSNSVVATSGDTTHRVFLCDSKANWRLDGLTIRNGSMWSTGVWPDQSTIQGIGIRALTVSGKCYIDNCVIRDNRPASTETYAGGLTLTVASPHSVTIRQTSFLSNKGTSGGGLILGGSGSILVQNCLIVSNQAQNGSGAFCNSDGTAIKFVNCGFYGNFGAPSDRGSGIRAEGANMLIANCTFVTNVGGAAVSENTVAADPQVLNCLFHQNKYIYMDENSAANLFTNDVALLNALAESDNNLSGDPMFEAPGSLNFRTRRGSPVIDAGTDASGYAPSADYYGNPRPIDWLDIGANGTGKEYDIGVYEMPPPPHGTVIIIR